MPDNMGEEIAFGDNLETETAKTPADLRVCTTGLAVALWR